MNRKIKIHRSHLAALLLFGVICFGSSCTEAVLDLNEPPVELGEITYDADIKALFTTNCTGACHNGPTPIGGIVLTGYSNARNHTENGSVLARINDSGNPMPPSGIMGSADRQMVQKWADDGYPEN